MKDTTACPLSPCQTELDWAGLFSLWKCSDAVDQNNRLYPGKKGEALDVRQTDENLALIACTSGEWGQPGSSCVSTHTAMLSSKGADAAALH